MFLWNIAVTSLAEVWIEIVVMEKNTAQSRVTSLAEVWIEILHYPGCDSVKPRHFPCGSVD